MTTNDKVAVEAYTEGVRRAKMIEAAKTPLDHLVIAAERALAYFEAHAAGRYIGDHEDLQAGAELSRALRAYYEESGKTFAQKVRENLPLPPFPILPGGKFLPKRGE
jgi:hypothetical protein